MNGAYEDFDPIAYINEPRWQESRLGLERTVELLRRLGNPQDRLRFVHVAGTNGKGSTCAYLESVLRKSGLRTGLFTSPYLVRFEERIRVDGLDISAPNLKAAAFSVREQADAMERELGEHPTEFELMFAVALVHFERSSCDIVVLEVGMGGRLDSTNAIPAPEACVIARIGLDHTAFLGSSIGDIAREKAGIIKAGSVAVVYPQEREAQIEIEKKAKEEGVELRSPDFFALEVGAVEPSAKRSFSYRGMGFETSLLGSYQPFNAALALECALALRSRGWSVPDSALVEGVRSAVWPGRFDVFPGTDARPFVVVDGGHNPQGAEALASSLKDCFPHAGCVFVMSVLADKDFRSMIDCAIPLARAFVCTTPANPRALPAADLAAAIEDRLVICSEDGARPSVLIAESMDVAFERACGLAGDGDVVCLFGSLYALKDAYAVLDRAGVSR